MIELRSSALQEDSLPTEPPSILEWVTYPFSGGSSQPRKWSRVSCIASRLFTDWATREWVKSLGRIRLFATPWTAAYQAPLSMGFFRQESWSGLLFPSPGDLPNPRIEPRSPTLKADILPSIREAHSYYKILAIYSVLLIYPCSLIST